MEYQNHQLGCSAKVPKFQQNPSKLSWRAVVARWILHISICVRPCLMALFIVKTREYHVKIVFCCLVYIILLVELQRGKSHDLAKNLIVLLNLDQIMGFMQIWNVKLGCFYMFDGLWSFGGFISIHQVILCQISWTLKEVRSFRLHTTINFPIQVHANFGFSTPDFRSLGTLLIYKTIYQKKAKNKIYPHLEWKRGG